MVGKDNFSSEVNLKKHFGKRLKRFVETAIIDGKFETKKQLAEEYLGCSPAALDAWCNGKNFPYVNYLLKICEIFDVSADYLLQLPGMENVEIAKEEYLSDLQSAEGSVLTTHRARVATDMYFWEQNEEGLDILQTNADHIEKGIIVKRLFILSGIGKALFISERKIRKDIFSIIKKQMMMGISVKILISSDVAPEDHQLLGEFGIIDENIVYFTSEGGAVPFFVAYSGHVIDDYVTRFKTLWEKYGQDLDYFR